MPASQYCTPTDLGRALGSYALDTVSSADQTQACIDASARADSYLRGRYGVGDGAGGYVQPILIAWGSDLTLMTSYVAAYLVMEGRGWNPNGSGDQNILRRYYEAIGDPRIPGSGWFPGVQRQAIHPDVTPNLPAGPNAGAGMPQVRSQALRGWSQNSGGVPSV